MELQLFDQQERKGIPFSFKNQKPYSRLFFQKIRAPREKINVFPFIFYKTSNKEAKI